MGVKLPPHQWIREKREDKKIRQSDVETATSKMGPKRRISQSHLSKIEKGHAPLLGLGAERMDALRKALGISLDEWVSGTGIQIVTEAEPVAEKRSLTHAERRGWVIPEEEIEREISPTLQEAADRYGHGPNAPLAERRWLVELNNLDFREEPETPEDWLAVYVRLSKILDPK